jgi:pulcherriminic acid synthase
LFDEPLNAYFISRYADVYRVLTDPIFTTKPLAERAEPVMGGRVLAQMEGSEHATKRRVLVRELNSPIARAGFARKIRSTARSLLEPLIAKGSFDLIQDFGKAFAVLVSLDILSLPHDKSRKIMKWQQGIADFVTNFQIDPARRAYDLACSRKLARYLMPVIKQRQIIPGNDLISTLATTAIDGHRMAVEDIVALSMNIVMAATEPAAKTIALLFHHLLENPDQLGRLQSDRSLIAPAIQETLRLTPPVQLIPRQPSQDVVLSGVAIKEGSLLFCLIGSANRDPEIFKNPDAFDLNRTTGDRSSSCTGKAEHLAFGAGMHVCVGAMFAEMEIDIVTNTILDLVESIRFSDDFIYQETGLYTRGPTNLKVQVMPRIPAKAPKGS